MPLAAVGLLARCLPTDFGEEPIYTTNLWRGTLGGHRVGGRDFATALGPDYYTRHHPRRTKIKVIKQLDALGYKVTLEPLTEVA